MNVLGRLDAYQRQRRSVALTLAVIYKFIDDQGTYMAALITYYGFLSLFPMLLLLVTVLGFALHGDAELQQQVLHSALSQFPVIGDQIERNIHSFHGSDFALAVGIAGSLYGALGVAQALQNAFNTVWAVPQHSRPNALAARLRGLALLGLLATALLVSSALAALTGTAHHWPTWVDWGARAAALPLSLAVDTVLLVTSFKLLTTRHLRVRLLWPEALGASLVWQGLLTAGTYYVGHELHGATATYGLFGIVLGLMAWIYLGALTLVVCAESAAVRTRHLWPRSVAAPFTDEAPLTRADRRAYTSYATAAAYKACEEVSVDFHPPATGSPAAADPPPPAGR
ncbi:YihY/virulence factor BrkB family protein [Kitasatospora sp. RB6PN24]|uniref:YihY/virulence factor BrkB family protein n=1 Tax=Kitasatospora humi TaxID=2893891 RepID=UPI001E56ECFC|nr:YihY/virulence factor BrkB family protein [Kitasatospora humi]MCC9309585.1 YihY/virulence factor BrkB family protein [Kitasatospora humi]